MKERRIPRATYRLQFSREFTFAQATELVPYFQRLGISHVYASPVLKARAGSSHGYDIVDHNSLNPELGGIEQFKMFVDALHRHGMGLILDLVPNHMGIAGGENGWWRDVLENGQASQFAAYFDIDWHPIREELRSKVLLPVLGGHYGQVIENGELVLAFDAQHGQFTVHYCEHCFPIDPETYPSILGIAIERLAALAKNESHVMTEWHTLTADFEQLRSLRNVPLERARASAASKQRLALLYAQSPAVRHFLGERLAEFNGVPGQPPSFDRLHQLLAQQSFRLAYWRVASDEINYRRFFDINELACLCQENPEVFDSTHRLVLALVADGSVDGLRIDHVDGLHDPADYCRRLRDGAARMSGEEAGGPAGPLYLVVEKILAGFEHLREDWPIEGTTGYEFAAQASGLFVHPATEAGLSRAYQDFAGRGPPFEDVLYQCKRQVIRTQLSSELTVLANQLNQIAQSARVTRDYTLFGLRAALMEVVACFPVYRTYIADRIGEEDRRFVEWAIAQAKKRSPLSMDMTVYDFLHDILLPRNGDPSQQDQRARIRRFTMRFQQYTAPVMAKGMEDTAFFVYNRLIACNEVGGDPRRCSVSVSAFHHANQQRLHRWPLAMLNTSTHDSKCGEDMRVRLDVISELAGEWRLHLSRWRRLNARKKRQMDDEPPIPSRNDEYRLYQTLLGAWPPDEGVDAVEALRGRVKACMLKAVREAKVHTAWINPNQLYEDAVTGFVERVLGTGGGNRFLDDFISFQRRVARFGMYNSLSQTLLKLTAPGVPDIYQGSELWNFSLVDPDNRRPVDFRVRRQILDEFERGHRAIRQPPEFIAGLLRHIADGRAKLYLIWRTLMLRRRHPEIFAEGTYLPLEASGDKAEHLCAYARQRNGAALVVVAARWFARLGVDIPVGRALWQGTRIQAPAVPGSRHFRDLLTGEPVRTERHEGGACFDLGTVLAQFPVALLFSQGRPKARSRAAGP